MAGLDHIIQQILDDANAQAKQKTDAAKKEAAEIEAAAKAEGQALSKEISQRASNDEKTASERAKSSADMQKRQATLVAKQEAINDVIEAAYQKVIGYDDDAYFALIEKMLEKYAQPKDGEIYLSEKDRGRMPAGFPQKISQIASGKGGSLTLASESKQLDGGFVLVYGGIEENCSIRSVFSAKQDELVDAVNAVLFSESAAQ